MIRINQIKLSIFEAGNDRKKEDEKLRLKAARLLKIQPEGIRKLRILRRSVDARDRSDIRFVYTITVKLRDSITGPTADSERDFIKKLGNRNIIQEEYVPVTMEKLPSELISALSDEDRPVIVGMGPCGLFAALVLAREGLRPIILERGSSVSERQEKVESFLSGGRLDPECNMQFGEGGAGTFSDGKLVTSIKGRDNYVRFVLEEFHKHGAPEDILYEQKPHVGTDILTGVVASIRDEIISLGGEVYFDTRLEDIEAEDGRVSAIILRRQSSGRRARLPECFEELSDGSYRLSVRYLILATGHSARDTYGMLKAKGLQMEAKPFAVGVRVQHPQELIDKALYGSDRLSEKRDILGPSAYKLTHTCRDGRGAYSFCMCPGGYVINSSSEEGRLAVNGMSYHDRGSANANSAIIVSVRPEDMEGDDPLRGMEFQRRLEERAYGLLSGVIPYETYKEFKEGCPDPAGISSYDNETRGFTGAADVASIFPEYIKDDIIEGMEAFDSTIKGFAGDDTIISGVESRTSAPVRIVRDESLQACIRGIYPAGEGAGYAGGITSSAVDGIKTSFAVIDSIKSLRDN